MYCRVFGSLVAALALVLQSGPARAAVETIPWWSNARWQVQAIPAASKCMASANYTAKNGQFFILAFEAFINDSAELLVFSPAWVSLYKKDRKYWVNVGFDNSKPQRLLAIAYDDGGIVFPDLTFDAILALAKSNSIYLGYKGSIIAGLNLPGSYEAVDQTISCSKALKSAVAAQHDDGTGPADEEPPATSLAPLQQPPTTSQVEPSPPPAASAPSAPTAPVTDSGPKPIDL